MIMVKNKVVLYGEVREDPIFDHPIKEKNIYRFSLDIERKSGKVDTIPILIPEDVLKSGNVKKGQFARIEGEFRSRSTIRGSKRRLALYVFARELDDQIPEMNNMVKLTGMVKSTPIYKETPSGLNLSNFMMAVQRGNRDKFDWLPIVAWNQSASYAESLSIDETVELAGRLENRLYKKSEDDGSSFVRVTYEVSTSNIRSVDKQVA